MNPRLRSARTARTSGASRCAAAGTPPLPPLPLRRAGHGLTGRRVFLPSQCATSACDAETQKFTADIAECFWYVGGGEASPTPKAQMLAYPDFIRGQCNKEYGKTTCTGRWMAIGSNPAGEQCDPDKIDASKLCDKSYVCTPFINEVNSILDTCKDDTYLKNDPAFAELPAQMAPVNKAKPKCEPEKKKDSAAPAQGIVGAAVGLLSFAALMLF